MTGHTGDVTSWGSNVAVSEALSPFASDSVSMSSEIPSTSITGGPWLVHAAANSTQTAIAEAVNACFTSERRRVAKAPEQHTSDP